MLNKIKNKPLKKDVQPVYFEYTILINDLSISHNKRDTLEYYIDGRLNDQGDVIVELASKYCHKTERARFVEDVLMQIEEMIEFDSPTCVEILDSEISFKVLEVMLPI